MNFSKLTHNNPIIRNTLFSVIITSVKFQIKLFIAKYLLDPYEHSIPLSTLWVVPQATGD